MWNAEPIWEKVKYTSQIDYLIGVSIKEYDMSKANISILYNAGAINKELYQELFNAPKYMREYQVGCMERDNLSISELVRGGIKEAKKQFILQNGLKLDEILAIKGDAVFVIGNRPMNTEITPIIQFKLANEYTSFYKISPFIEVFYSYLPINDIERFDAKGMEKSLYLHQDHMMNYLCSLFYTAQVIGVDEAIKNLIEFYKAYIDRALDINYYRRFDASSMFDINPFEGQEATTFFKAASWTEDKKDMIDIHHNAKVLSTIYRIYASIILNKK